MFNTHKNRNLVYIIYFALSAEIRVHAVVILWKGSKTAIILWKYVRRIFVYSLWYCSSREVYSIQHYVM